MPLLSIVIPTYNEEAILPLLLNSIEYQDFIDYEVIVADNNSIDDTRAIAAKHGATITKGGMPSVGRNAGAFAAKGNYILFIDADTILPNGFLSNLVEEFRYKELGVATVRIYPLSNRISDIILHDLYNVCVGLLAKRFPIAPGFCIIVNRFVHNAIGGFDESIVFGEDTDYAQRAAKVSQFGVLETTGIDVSVRRLDRDGRFVVAVKYVLAGLYMMLGKKIRTNVFRYSFGHKVGK